MSPVPADTPALRLALAFANTHDLLASPPDCLSVAVLQRLAREHGQPDLAHALAGADLDELRALRGRIYPVFAGGTPGERVTALRDLLAAEGALATLVDGGDGRPRLAVAPAGPDPVRRLGALVADALAQAMAAGGPDRFGTCAGDPCRCVYLDRTRAGRQRYCCQLCNDRLAALAYRARRAGGR
jgi:predicted RNA-binding Zn ribbon-like protein